MFCGIGQQAGLAQTGEWTWMGGSKDFNTCPDTLNCGERGVYGSKGTPSPGNVPGGRAGALSWTGSDGLFWLFSGTGFDSAGNSGGIDDLWKFDPTQGLWTWVGGSSTLPGLWKWEAPVFGTKGVGSTANTPGFRDQSNRWRDASGNLWVFGGRATANPVNNSIIASNDLWKYEPSTGKWTWVGGDGTQSDPGVYQRFGQPSVLGWPGARVGAASCTDRAGNFWLFGGVGYDSVQNLGKLNDLWSFSPISQEWTWMAGSSTVLPPGYTGATDGGPNPVYGTLGIPDPANTPGGREGAVCWADSGGNLWLFGGNGPHLYGGFGHWNDLWEFNPATREWTWMMGIDDMPNCGRGSQQCGNFGVYGTIGVAAAGNTPGARRDPTTWSDNDGNAWLFGGTGVDSQGNYGYLDDLWEFSPVTREWTWEGGNSSILYPNCTPNPYAYYCGNRGNYGQMGTPGPTNNPGGRNFASSWTDGNGNLWLFGGTGYFSEVVWGYLNDLWMFKPETSALPGASAPTISPASGTYYAPQTVTITDATPRATIYFSTDGIPPTLNSPIYSEPLTVTGNEVVEAIAIADGYSVSGISTGAFSLPQGFKLGVSPGTLSLNGGSSGNVAVTLTPYNGFNSAVNLACLHLPVGATCSFSPATVTLADSSVTATLTVTAPKQTAAAPRNGNNLTKAALARCFSALDGHVAAVPHGGCFCWQDVPG